MIMKQPGSYKEAMDGEEKLVKGYTKGNTLKENSTWTEVDNKLS